MLELEMGLWIHVKSDIPVFSGNRMKNDVLTLFDPLSLWTFLLTVWCGCGNQKNATSVNCLFAPRVGQSF